LPIAADDKDVIVLHAIVQALPYVMLLIAMLFFIYAIIGMQVTLAMSSYWPTVYKYLTCVPKLMSGQPRLL